MQSPVWDPGEVSRFFEGYFYSRDIFYISDVIEADPAQGLIVARAKENTKWLVTPHQRGKEDWHPRHIGGADMVSLTASLGSLHAYFFHQCHWHEGWVGFGNRMENVEFKGLATTDKPLELRSKETRLRKGPKRVLIEFDFEFSQEGKPVYLSRQMATFFKR